MQKVAMVVPAAEARMAKLVAEEETAGMRLGIIMERTAKMVLGAASKFNVFQCPTESDGAMK
jgi:hypothetical protein